MLENPRAPIRSENLEVKAVDEIHLRRRQRRRGDKRLRAGVARARRQELGRAFVVIATGVGMQPLVQIRRGRHRQGEQPMHDEHAGDAGADQS